MEIVINISKSHYKALQQMRKGGLGFYHQAILNGTVLPEGHGKIGDLDKLIRAMKERNDDNGGEPLNAVDRGYDLAFQHMIEESKECVIIEADREKK